MGHEAIGVVDDVGADVRGLKPGGLVVMPFASSDGICPFCRQGLLTACVHVAFFGNNGLNGAQGRGAARAVRPTGPCTACPWTRTTPSWPRC